VLEGVRFSGDTRSEAAIRGDADLNRLADEAVQRGGAWSTRRHALASAVKVHLRLLPELADSIRQVAERARVSEAFECFVFADDSINAMVMDATDRKVVMLSSASVERLRGPELAFVIGHELGHASYGHLRLPVDAMLSGNNLDPRQMMRLRAWQRKAEISADRAGLVCCGSIAVAATALFKTLSGLDLPGFSVDPEQFAAQWDELAREMVREGGAPIWFASHPFPPLRMKALLNFWSSDVASQLIAGASGDDRIQAVDSEIESLLATMDPLARESEGTRDPMLEEFLLWGGMFIAASNDSVNEPELTKIRSLTGPATFETLAELGTGAAPDAYRERFIAARKARRKPLSGLEVHRIFSGLIAIVRADGDVADRETAALRVLAEACGVSPVFIDRIMDQ